MAKRQQGMGHAFIDEPPINPAAKTQPMELRFLAAFDRHAGIFTKPETAVKMALIDLGVYQEALAQKEPVDG